MKKLSMLMALAFCVVLTTVAITPVTFAQEPLDIPNIQGLWKVSITEYGTGQDGTEDVEKGTGTVYICQCEYENDHTPNIALFEGDHPEDDEGWRGFVQGVAFAISKIDFCDDSLRVADWNKGTDVVTGILSKNGKRFSAETMGYDSNQQWGALWHAKINGKKISDDTEGYCDGVCPLDALPEPICPPIPTP